MTRILTTLAPVALAVLLVGALAGCTPGAGSPTPGGSASTPAPIITGTAADTATPQPALDIDCSGLAAAGSIAAAFGPSVHAVDPLVTQGLETPTVPDAFVIQTMGGISCEWNNGVPFVGVPTATSYVGAQLAILPRATTQWAHYNTTYGAAAEGVFCTSTDPQIVCESEQLVGSTWVALWMYGAVSEAQAHTLAASVTAAVSAAPAGAPAWTPPSSTRTFGDCASLLTPAQVQADLGVTGASILFTLPAGGWSIQAAARENADAVGCLLQYAGEDSTPGQISWLRGGEWAYDLAASTSDPGWGASTPVTIAGLATGDRATERCTDPTTPDYEGLAICTVNLALGGNWIQVVFEPNPGDHAAADPRVGALAVAAHLVTGFNAHAH